MPMELPEQIETFREFFEVNTEFRDILHEQVRAGRLWVTIAFSELAKHSPELAELLLEQPEEVLKAGEVAIEKMDLPHSSDAAQRKVEVRIAGLPKQHQLEIRVIRAQHLERFVEIVGIVRQKSDVRPQVTAARFECPSCGQIIPVLQVDTKFKEPPKCGCGRKGHFRLLSKDMIDAQSLTLEEAPEDLEGGEQPKRLKILLKKDLVSPMTDKRTNPGSKIRVVGIVKEVPIILQTGGQSTRYDLILDANHVETLQEDFTEIILSPEDEQEIMDLSQDPDLFEKLVASIAPSIYGHEPIKQALLLQMFGGVHKARDRGVKSRGDIHMLLIGDPGSGKCVTGDTLVQLADGTIAPIAEVFSKHRGESKGEGAYAVLGDLRLSALDRQAMATMRATPTLWKRVEKENLLELTLRSGERLTVTKDHPLFTAIDCQAAAVPARELRVGMPIACPRTLRVETSLQEIPGWRRSRAHNAVRIRAPAFVSIDIARFLGYLAGDGRIESPSVKEACMISFTNNDEGVLADYARIVRDEFGIACARRHPHRGKTASELYTTSSELHSLVERLAPEIARKAGEKSIPAAVMRSPDEQVVAFLRGLFECDGHNCRAKREIELCTKSRRLAREVKMLLLRFGISSHIHEKLACATNTESRIKRTYYSVKVTGQDVSRFQRRIGFVSERKNSVFAAHPSGFNTNRDVLPGVGGILRMLRHRHGLSISDMNVPSGSYRHYEKGDRMPSREQLTRIVAAFGSIDDPQVDLLRRFGDADIFWDFVERIDEIAAPPEGTEVYDFEIDDVHNFVANGVSVHNSQMLKRISTIAPKARFVAGKGASGAGLTAAVVKDDFLKGWALEAGALVLANRGIVCIDELDKMSKEDTSAMHEALEQQQVSIAKANIQATLRCETTVLAAANPKFGRFDPFEILSKQIDLPPALISRFDLIFPVRDMPDRTKDEKLASFILSLHKDEGGKEGIIVPETIKKYVAYARQRCFPKLTEAAVAELKTYYVKMRGGDDERTEQQAIKAVPITARQLEALVRLSEASARVRLSDKVTRMDAQRAIELVHYCMQQIGMDPETGKFDMDRVMTGISASQRSHISVVKEIIQELENSVGKVIPVEDVVREAGIKGIAQDTANDVIERLKRGGDIYSPKHGFISRV